MKKKAVEYTINVTKQEFTIAKIKGAEDAQAYARNFYHEDILIYESSYIMLLNQANNVMGYAKISQGGICLTVVDVRIIAKYAIEAMATGVIFVHNHPSGTLSPSQEDRKITIRIKEALKLLDIKLLDSIIISDTGYYSFNNEGLI